MRERIQKKRTGKKERKRNGRSKRTQHDEISPAMFGRNPGEKAWLRKNYRITRKSMSHVDHFQVQLKLGIWTIITLGEEDSGSKETRKCLCTFITTFTFCSRSYTQRCYKGQPTES
jgi:hypothetical protein